MSIRSAIKALAPGFLTETVRAHRELAMIEGSTAASAWIAASSFQVQSSIHLSRFNLFPKELRRPLSLVVDVGANRGDWISSLLRLVPVHDSWVFEPNPQAMTECRRRLKRFRGIHFREIALGSSSAKAVLHVSRASEFSSLRDFNTELIASSYGSDPLQIISEQPVQVQTLDSVLSGNRSVDLLKLDVQGYEREVLAGAVFVLKRTYAILLEINFQSHYDGDDVFESLYKLLSNHLGFTLWNISSPYRSSSGEPLWADALFINRSFELSPRA